MWMSKIKQFFESELKKPLMALFGNKSDLEHQRAVRLSCVQKFASEHLLETFKGSARTGEMVNYTLKINLVCVKNCCFCSSCVFDFSESFKFNAFSTFLFYFVSG